MKYEGRVHYNYVVSSDALPLPRNWWDGVYKRVINSDLGKEKQ